MKSGEIYLANLDPTIGSEIKKSRPVVIVSNDINNKFSETITIVPLTSNIKVIHPFEVLIDKKKFNLKNDSKAKCHQIRTISKKRISGNMLTKLDKILMNKIKDALKIHLDI